MKTVAKTTTEFVITSLEGLTVKESLAVLERLNKEQLYGICEKYHKKYWYVTNAGCDYAEDNTDMLVWKVLRLAYEKRLIKTGVSNDMQLILEAYGVKKFCEMYGADEPDGVSEEIRALLKKDYGIDLMMYREATEEDEAVQSAHLYEEDACADNGGDNSAPEQDIPVAHIPDETPAPVKRQHTMRVIMLANKYAEARGTAQAIRDGIKTFRKCIKMWTRQGLSVDGLVKAIKGVREKYREWRVEAFKLRRKLLRVMSAAEIRLACEAYTARCEEIRRGHLARK